MAPFRTILPYRRADSHAETEIDTIESSDKTDSDYFEDGDGGETELPSRPKVMRLPQSFGQNTQSGGNARRDLQVRTRH